MVVWLADAVPVTVSAPYLVEEAGKQIETDDDGGGWFKKRKEANKQNTSSSGKTMARRGCSSLVLLFTVLVSLVCWCGRPLQFHLKTRDPFGGS